MRYWPPFGAKTTVEYSLPYYEIKQQGTANDFRSCILGSLRTALWQWFKYKVIAAFKADTMQDIYITKSWKWLLTEC